MHAANFFRAKAPHVILYVQEPFLVFFMTFIDPYEVHVQILVKT